MKLKSMSKDDIKQLKFDKDMMKMKNKFIGTLKIPCYDNCKLFYYYDVLEALSRYLFQNIIFQRAEIIANEELRKEKRKKANHDNSDDNDDKKSESMSIDFFSDDSESEEELTEI